MANLDWDRGFALEQSGDDEEMLEELLGLFRDSSASDLAKIQQGAASDDAVQIAEAAHSIKGAAASLGVQGIQRVAADLEKAGRAEDLATAKQRIPDLESLLEEASSLK